tara:strand:- start:15509 stop:15757 length:249 start_codon:yes stop_codon:yes gene_type:complete
MPNAGYFERKKQSELERAQCVPPVPLWARGLPPAEQGLAATLWGLYGWYEARRLMVALKTAQTNEGAAWLAVQAKAIVEGAA